jgi:hypothetical protein
MRVEIGPVGQTRAPADLLELIAQRPLERSQAAMDGEASVWFELSNLKRLLTS